MLFLKKPLAILVLSVLLTSIITGCYKKDLAEFKKLNTLTYTPDVVVPFLEKRITLSDTIPTVPGFTSVTMSDTASVELPDSKNKDTLESVIEQLDFKVRIENTFPFSGFVQIYFADSNNVFTDSLLDNSQRVVSPGTPVLIKELAITVDKQRYIKLTKKSKNMYLYYNLTTSNISNLSSKYLLINMGMKAKVSVDVIK